MSGYSEGIPGPNMPYHSQHRPSMQVRVRSTHCFPFCEILISFATLNVFFPSLFTFPLFHDPLFLGLQGFHGIIFL